MKRIIILVILVALAGIAGIVARSASRGEFKELVSHNAADVREEIRQSYELAPGAQVEVVSINGSVRVETTEGNKAEVFIERTASSQEVLDRRRVTIDAAADHLRIRAEKNENAGFFAKIFGREAGERVTLKLPRQVSLLGKGINGSVHVGEMDGSVEMNGVNGRIEVGRATGTATFKGINGSVVVGLGRLSQEGVRLDGINGNIELQLTADTNADLEARGINGRVISELPNVTVDKSKGSYSARIGAGGSSIAAKGINGNIRLSRSAGSPSGIGN